MATPQRCSRAWNLRIRSDIALAGAMPELDDGAVDLDIALGTAALVNPGEADGPYRLGRDSFAFAMPEVARYVCTRTRIVVDEAPGACRDHVAAMLVATVIPAVLWMRGDVVLHAAAAILPGATQATAVLGQSGSGKSTLLARVVSAGARLVADDSIRLHRANGEIRISGLAGGFFGPLANGAERRFHPVPYERRCAEAALGGIVVLDDRPCGRLTGADAVTALLTHRHRPRIARLLGIDHHALAMLTAVCIGTPLVRCAVFRHGDIAAALPVS